MNTTLEHVPTTNKGFRLTLALVSCMPTAIFYTIFFAVGLWYDESIFEDIPSWYTLQEIIRPIYGWSGFYLSAVVAALVGGLVYLLSGHLRTMLAISAGLLAGGSCLWLWTMAQPPYMQSSGSLHVATAADSSLVPPLDRLFFLPQFQFLLFYYALLYGVVQELALRLYGLRPGPWAAATALGIIAGGSAVLWLPVPEMHLLLPLVALTTSLGAGLFQLGLIKLRYKLLLLPWIGASMQIGVVNAVAAVLLVLPLGPFLAWLPGLLCGILTANALLNHLIADAVSEAINEVGLAWFTLFSAPAIIASLPLMGLYMAIILFRFEDALVIPAVLVGTFLLALSLITGGIVAQRQMNRFASHNGRKELYRRS
jgi:hypothetical protein